MDGDERYGLLSGITTITEGVCAGADTVLESSGWSLSDAEARDAVEALWQAKARLEAAYLHALRVLDARPDALDGAGKGRVAATFLIGRLHVDGSTAAADVRAAQAVDPDSGGLARMGAALAAGEVSRQHVDVAVTAVAKLPKAALAQHLPVETDDAGEDSRDGLTGAQFVDRWLTEHARRESPRTLRAMACGLQDRIDPDHEDRSFDRTPTSSDASACTPTASAGSPRCARR